MFPTLTTKRTLNKNGSLHAITSNTGITRTDTAKHTYTNRSYIEPASEMINYHGGDNSREYQLKKKFKYFMP